MSTSPSTVEALQSFRAQIEARLKIARIELARRVGFEPRGWQVAALQSEAKRVLYNCTRQGGKSSVTAILALHNMLYNPGSATLVVSEAERQSKNMLKKIRAFYSALRRPERPIYESRTELQLPSGSFVVALPGTSGASRSFSGVSLLIIDEAARVMEEAINAATPTQSTVPGARLVALSSPNGKRGMFYDWWVNGGDEWERHTATWNECPWISPEFIEHERARMPEAVFAQEYMCEFRETEESAFSYSDIERAFQKGVETWDLSGGGS